MKTEWLRKAVQNLDDEAEFVAKENPLAAQLLVGRIHRAVFHLGENPAVGRAGRIQGTRELVVPSTPYIIPYRVNAQAERIEILRVLHASRKLPKRW